MSNSTKTYGFKPYGSMDSKGYGGIRPYFLPSSAASVGIGDVVIRTLGMNTSDIQILACKHRHGHHCYG